MNESVTSKMPTPTPSLKPAALQAEPEPLEIDLKRTAVIVVDMQNVFVSKGGFLDLVGDDITNAQKTVGPIKKINSLARAKGVKVIYTKQGYSSDLHETGGPNSAYWHKMKPLKFCEDSKFHGKYLIRGTWGTDIIEELKPEEGDIVVDKAAYSAFFETNLNTILKTFDIKYLVVTGVGTNICVEATIRDAFYRGYFPILVSDATGVSGPSFIQEATEFNLKRGYGWVTSTENVIRVMKS